MPADYDRQQAALLAAVWDGYDDDAPRLAYADWLESVGDPADTARAEYIRLGVRFPGAPHGSPEALQAGRRMAELLKKYKSVWLAGLPPGFDSGRYTSQSVRGMLEVAGRATPAQWLTEGDRWFRRMPPDVVIHAYLERGYGPRQEPAPDWAALFAKPWWERVVFLSLARNELTAAGLSAVGSHPGFRRLRQLLLGVCAIGDAGAMALAEAPHLGQLRRLDVNSCGITAAGAAALAARANMPHLESLMLVGNPLGEEGWAAVAAAAAPAGGVVESTTYGQPRQVRVVYPSRTHGDIPF